MLKKSKNHKIKDVFKAYLVKDSRKTYEDGFPVIEDWMVAKQPPKEIIQWDRRSDVIDPSLTGMSFYCNDIGFRPIINNPKKYVELLKKYQCVIGLDASPYDDMPLYMQKYQIGTNLSITYYFAKQGIRIIPNVRLGNDRTLSALAAYPKHTLIAVGTNGFVKLVQNRQIFKKQLEIVIDELEPSGICVYGPTPSDIFSYANDKKIPIYQYDSYTMKQNKIDKLNKKGGDNHER